MPLDVISLSLAALLAVVLIGVAVYAMRAKSKARRQQRQLAAIRAVLLDYFKRSGVEVAVSCFRLPDSSSFTAVVESEPMKRFRLSHIIEMTLREHVRKACGLELDKVYWRFPVKQAAQAAGATADAKPDEHSDEYINEGLEHYRHIPKPEVEELDWEQFERAAIASLPKKDEAQ
ncbi:hypothetical protein E4K72_13385 [Oxalobacteraceae bacterium OM1]|nr:hypothetical protein E4K72_13385 [Oxalobacteraceae bacterium OM1]